MSKQSKSDEKNELINQVFDALKDAPTIMVGLNRNADHSEPMHACLQEDNQSQIWFFTDKDNRIAPGGKTTVQYTNSEKDLYLSAIGQLKAEEDEKLIKDLYSPIVGAFFEDGLQDKSLRVLRFDISSMEIWKQDMSMATKLKMLVGISIDPDDAGTNVVVENV